MSSELMGLFLHVPEKLTPQEKTILKNHVTKQKNLLAKLKKMDDASIKLIMEDDKLKQEIEQATSVEYLDEQENTFFFENIVTDLEEFINLIESFSNEFDLGNNDCAYTMIKTNNRNIVIYFSGGESWGGEPDNFSYRVIQKLSFAGIETMFYKFCYEEIPQSVQFINSEDI